MLKFQYSMHMHSVIILPTYNEKENLAGLVSDIFSVGIENLHIIIVDDNSPDGTGRIAQELADKNEKVKVLHRSKKEGLGKAYVAGFQMALKEKKFDYILEMDADFSHQPKHLSGILEKIKQADLVIGSRYVSGGGIENWGLIRRFISWAANYTIRILLGVPIRDLTGGFKCFRREVLEQMNLSDIESRGYNFQIELTYKVYKKGLRITEVPITFIERRAGDSKFSMAIMLESFLKVIKLRFKK